MSTLKCDNLQNIAGTKTVPVNTVVDDSASALVNFNGTGVQRVTPSTNGDLADDGADYVMVAIF